MREKRSTASEKKLYDSLLFKQNQQEAIGEAEDEGLDTEKVCRAQFDLIFLSSGEPRCMSKDTIRRF